MKPTKVKETVLFKGFSLCLVFALSVIFVFLLGLALHGFVIDDFTQLKEVTDNLTDNWRGLIAIYIIVSLGFSVLMTKGSD